MAKTIDPLPRAVTTWGELHGALSEFSAQIRSSAGNRLSEDIRFGSNLYRIKWTPYAELGWCKNLFAKARCWWTGAEGSVSCKTYRIIERNDPGAVGTPETAALLLKGANPLDSFLNRIMDTFTLSKHLAIGCAFLESRDESMVRVVRAMHDGKPVADPRFRIAGAGM